MYHMIFELDEVGIDCLFGRIIYSMLVLIDISVKLALACMGDPKKQASKEKKKPTSYMCRGL